MPNVDIQNIANEVSMLFGLNFTGMIEDERGALWSVIRPVDFMKPNGFGVVVESTYAAVNATFVLDDQAGELIHPIPDTEQGSFAIFDEMRIKAENLGHAISFAINSDAVTTLSEYVIKDYWMRIDLNCSIKFPFGKKPDQNLINKYAIDASTTCLALILELLPVITEDPFATDLPDYPEGSQMKSDATRYVRDPRNRSKCLKYHGYSCKACGLDFGEQYGPIGKGFIEVHHTIPVSQMGGSYIIDPVKDLVPLCSNCHSIAHRDRHQQKPRSVFEIKELLELGNQNQKPEL